MFKIKQTKKFNLSSSNKQLPSQQQDITRRSLNLKNDFNNINNLKQISQPSTQLVRNNSIRPNSKRQKTTSIKNNVLFTIDQAHKDNVITIQDSQVDRPSTGSNFRPLGQKVKSFNQKVQNLIKMKKKASSRTLNSMPKLPAESQQSRINYLSNVQGIKLLEQLFNGDKQSKQYKKIKQNMSILILKHHKMSNNWQNGQQISFKQFLDQQIVKQNKKQVYISQCNCQKIQNNIQSMIEKRLLKLNQHLLTNKQRQTNMNQFIMVHA